MMRRRHKKSRRGCLECKRRHIKCDETRPNCINCTTAERDCSYPAQSGSDGTSTAGHSPTAEGGPSNFSLSASPPMSSYPTSSGGPSTAGGLYGGGDMAQFTLGGLQEVNMGHMELFHHFMTDGLMMSACYPELSGEIIKTAAVQHALREPFLMYQILSVSARHLCFLRPESSAFYQAQAIHLQSRALHLFNNLDVTAAVGGYFQRSRSNLVAVCLFSSLVGIQSLSEMLSHRDHEFPAALGRFLTYIRLHRGLNRLLDGHRHELAETEISPVLEMMGRPPWFGAVGSGRSGHECDDLRRRILLVPDLRNDVLEEMLKAIDLLQFVIDGQQLQLVPPQHSTESRSHVLLSWPVLMGDTFVELLETGRPEALAVLGYYFVALHYCRDVCWICCGSSGHYLLTLLSGYLGHKWGDWIATPCRLLREALEREDAQQSLVGIEATTAATAAGLFLSATTASPVAEHSMAHGHGLGHGHGLLGQQPGPSYWKP